VFVQFVLFLKIYKKRILIIFNDLVSSFWLTASIPYLLHSIRFPCLARSLAASPFLFLAN
jgi:hypothetical protein